MRASLVMNAALRTAGFWWKVRNVLQVSRTWWKICLMKIKIEDSRFF